MSKVEQVTARIRQLIQENQFKEGRLPAEPEMARRMAASRATVRQALANLEQAGLIVRKHGSGTYVNRHFMEIRTRLSEVWDFEEMIRLAGQRAGVLHRAMSLARAEPDLAQQLSLKPGEEVLKTANVFLANDAPVIYCVDVIPARLVNRAYRDEELHGPVLSFLENRCDQRLDYTVTEVKPVAADEALADLLACEIGAPLHYFEEIGFNAEHLPILYSQEYYRPEFFAFKLVRKMTSVRGVQ